MTLRCHSCRHRCDPVDPATGRPPAVPPRPGDFWLCRQCGELHRFGPYRAIRGCAPIITLRPAELAELEVLEPNMRAELLAQRDQVRRPN